MKVNEIVSFKIRQIAVFVFFLTIAACSSQQVKEAVTVSPYQPKGILLSGNWMLNHDLSDDLRVAFGSSAKPTEEVRGGRKRDGSRRGEKGTRGEKGKRNSENHLISKKQLEIISPYDETLLIDQQGSYISLAYGKTNRRNYFYGKSDAHSNQVGISSQVSGWQNNQYVIASETDDNIEITERISISYDGKILIIGIEISKSNADKSIYIRKVYNKSKKVT